MMKTTRKAGEQGSGTMKRQQRACGMEGNIRPVVTLGACLLAIAIPTAAHAEATIELRYDKSVARDPVSFEAVTKSSWASGKQRWPLFIYSLNDNYYYGIVRMFDKKGRHYYLCKIEERNLLLESHKKPKDAKSPALVPIIIKKRNANWHPVSCEDSSSCLNSEVEYINSIGKLTIKPLNIRSFEEIKVGVEKVTRGNKYKTEGMKKYHFEPRMVSDENDPNKAPVAVVLACPRNQYDPSKKHCKISNKQVVQLLRDLERDSNNPGWRWPRWAELPECPQIEPSSMAMEGTVMTGMEMADQRPGVNRPSRRQGASSRSGGTEVPPPPIPQYVRIMLVDENGRRLRDRQYEQYRQYQYAVILPGVCKKEDNRRGAFERNGKPLRRVPLGGLKDRLSEKDTPVCIVLKKQQRDKQPLCRDWALYKGFLSIQLPINGAQRCQKPEFGFIVEGINMALADIQKLLKGLGVDTEVEGTFKNLKVAPEQEQKVREALGKLFKTVRSTKKGTITVFEVANPQFMPLSEIKVRLQYSSGGIAKNCKPALQLHKPAQWIAADATNRGQGPIDMDDVDTETATYTFDKEGKKEGKKGWIVRPYNNITLKMRPIKAGQRTIPACRLQEPNAKLTKQQLRGKQPVIVRDSTVRFALYHASSRASDYLVSYKSFHEKMQRMLESIIKGSCKEEGRKGRKCEKETFVWQDDSWRKPKNFNDFSAKIWSAAAGNLEPKYERISEEKGTNNIIFVDSSQTARSKVCKMDTENYSNKIKAIYIRGMRLEEGKQYPKKFTKEGVARCDETGIILIAPELMEYKKEKIQAVVQKAVKEIFETSGGPNSE